MPHQNELYRHRPHNQGKLPIDEKEVSWRRLIKKEVARLRRTNANCINKTLDRNKVGIDQNEVSRRRLIKNEVSGLRFGQSNGSVWAAFD